MDRGIANSRFTARLCEEAGVSMDRIGIVNPGVTVPPPLHDNDTRARALREFHGLGDGPCLLSIGRMTARTGLRAFRTDARRVRKSVAGGLDLGGRRLIKKKTNHINYK